MLGSGPNTTYAGCSRVRLAHPIVGRAKPSARRPRRATTLPNKAMKLTKLSPAPWPFGGAGSCPRRPIIDAGTASQLIASVRPTWSESHPGSGDEWQRVAKATTSFGLGPSGRARGRRPLRRTPASATSGGRGVRIHRTPPRCREEAASCAAAAASSASARPARARRSFRYSLPFVTTASVALGSGPSNTGDKLRSGARVNNGTARA